MYNVHGNVKRSLYMYMFETLDSPRISLQFKTARTYIHVQSMQDARTDCLIEEKKEPANSNIKSKYDCDRN